MSDVLAPALWPLARVSEVVEALGAHAGLCARATELPPAPEDACARLAAGDHAETWIERAAEALGFEAEPVEATWVEVAAMLRTAAPALVVLPAGEGREPGLVALCGPAGRWGTRVPTLGPDLRVRAVPVEVLREALCAALEAPPMARATALMARAGVPSNRRAASARALVAEQLGAAPVGGCWLLRADPGDRFDLALRRAGVVRRVVALLSAQFGLYAALGVAWVILGRGALEGTLDRAWLAGWFLALLSAIPLQLLVAWHGGRLALDVGAALKQRLLVGATRLDPEVVRSDGAGAMLGRVAESAAVEANALSGAMSSLAAVPQLVAATAVLWRGVGGALQAAAFVGWVAVGVLVALRYGIARARWTRARVEMTNDIVERMVGHRTRAAQERPDRWHDGEDKGLERYLVASRDLDRTQAWLSAAMTRGWTVIGVATLAPSLADATQGPLALAVGVGAVLFAGGALRLVTGGIVSLLAAAIAWREVAPLFRAAASREPRAASLITPPRGAPGSPLLEAEDLVFRHAGRAEPVLRGVSLRVDVGDRVLLEGASGSGKSTLGAVLAGLRAPTSGLLLMNGLDPRSLGPLAWRRRVVAAPQFHENHVMTGTLAFNLLFGRRWPPTPEDLREAEEVCRELALGELLDRMPAGLQQMVGESGWRLSHGEQSRVFMARALLQGADLVVLDESLAALDPETLQRALACAFRRCPALLVIAHP
ncbi:MAG: ABC transporter ATP-binding protein [Polyangiales bacterium]